jgi:hypothetical protein
MGPWSLTMEVIIVTSGLLGMDGDGIGPNSRYALAESRRGAREGPFGAPRRRRDPRISERSFCIAPGVVGNFPVLADPQSTWRLMKSAMPGTV